MKNLTDKLLSRGAESLTDSELVAAIIAEGASDERIAQAGEFLPDLPEELNALAEEGYLEHVGGRWRPARQGWLCGNDLYGRLLDLGNR
jgi:oxygen-independent coproporphyrinogen-3 oxidase